MISAGQVGCTPLIYCLLVVSKEGMENKSESLSRLTSSRVWLVKSVIWVMLGTNLYFSQSGEC